MFSAFCVLPIHKEDSNPNQMKYPFRAIQEAVINAIVHRDYEIEEPIRITVFLDRIEINSPGALLRSIDSSMFKSGKECNLYLAG